MVLSVPPPPHRRSHLPSRTYRSLLHLCSSFDGEPRVSLATPAVLRELVLRSDKEIAQVSPGETCKPGETCPVELQHDNSSMLEPRSEAASGESKPLLDIQNPASNEVETSYKEERLIVGDVFDAIDLDGQHHDIFRELELTINEEDLVPESCMNLFEALDVNDYDNSLLDYVTQQTLDPLQNVVANLSIATKPQGDPVQGEKKDIEVIGFPSEKSKAMEVPKSVECNEGMSSGSLKKDNETQPREMEEAKPSNSSPVMAVSVSQMIEDDDDVEEGEISGDDNDDMPIEDDVPVKRLEESHISQELDPVIRKKRSAPTLEKKARKRAKARKKRAQERIALGVKKLKLKPVAPKPKLVKYCRHYLKGRCHEGEKCKFSHDTTPLTKSMPCCYFATQSCMKGDDCAYDHDLAKYPCNNFITKGVCHRGDSCLFSHKDTPQSASDALHSNPKPNASVTTSSTNITATSFSFGVSPQKTNKQTVREAIAGLPAIQARVSSPGPVAFLKPPSSQSNERSSSESSPKISELVTPPQIPPFRKSSLAPKGLSFLSSDKTTEKNTAKPQPSSYVQNLCNPGTMMPNSDDQNLKQAQQRSSLPPVPPKGISFLSFASDVCSGSTTQKPLDEQQVADGEPKETPEVKGSNNPKGTHNSHIQSSLLSAMKLAAQLESAKSERGINKPAAVNKLDVNSSLTKNSGNISSKILEFLSSFSHDNKKRQN